MDIFKKPHSLLMTEETPDPLRRGNSRSFTLSGWASASTTEVLSLISIRKDVYYHPEDAVTVLTLSKSIKLGPVINMFSLITRSYHL